jgi:hypothetical protein
MFNLSKAESTLLTSSAVLITITILFQDPKSGIISGMLTALFSHIKVLHEQFARRNRKALLESKELSKRCVNLLQINNNFLSDDWLFCSLQKIIESDNSSQKHCYLLTLVREQISQGIEEAKVTLDGRMIEYLGSQREIKRQSILTDIIKESRHYIKAVTSFDPVYWKTFWKNTNISEKYIQANISAAQKGVDIERIFLLPDAILEGGDQENSATIRAIMLSMVKKHPNLQIKCVSTDDMHNAIAPYQNAGLLVADDLFVAVSYSPSQLDLPYTEGGYIAIAIREEIIDALHIFETLEQFAKPAESFPFLRKK